MKCICPSPRNPDLSIGIYGLFDDQDICRYVGATKHPKKRSFVLQHEGNKEKWPACEMRVFFWCTPEQAYILESKVIEMFKGFGQCDLNKRLQGRRPDHNWHHGKWPQPLALSVQLPTQVPCQTLNCGILLPK